MSNNRCPKNKIFCFRSVTNIGVAGSPDAFCILIRNAAVTVVMTLLYQNTDTEIPYFLKTVLLAPPTIHLFSKKVILDIAFHSLCCERLDCLM
jgi:hypothetical protein